MGVRGTVVTYGRGQGVVVATDMSNQFGRIPRLVQTVEAGRTPLQENLEQAVLNPWEGGDAIVVALIVGLGLWRGLPVLDMFIFGIRAYAERFAAAAKKKKR